MLNFIYKINKISVLYLRFLLIIIAVSGNAVFSQTEKIQGFKHPDWSYNKTIYEVNVRQYTPEGTFEAFAENLPRLKNLGVGILWFMPINPIGIKNRKGSLGSYYSVRNYTEINPEFGTLQNFKDVVKHAHNLGMHVIIDWVANHTAWDNPWITSHPDFYTKDSTGNFVSPFDWSDVVDLNYDNKELWNYMRDAMKYWIDECNIDGFRCDVAAMVPLEFWKWVRPQLEKTKKIFMLAEASEPEMHEAFDMTYNWQLKDLFVDIAKNKKCAEDVNKYYEQEKITYPRDAYRMVFTTNHDENSWNGTDSERFGDFAECFTVVTGVVNGMQLVYSGQEAGLNKRLKFFDKDTIVWKESKFKDIFTKLASLKKENQALWNGSMGGEMEIIDPGDSTVFSFVRKKNDNKIFAVFNFSDSPKDISFTDTRTAGEYKNAFNDSTTVIDANQKVLLKPYGYLVLYK